MNNSFNENQHKIEEEFAIFEMDNDDYSTNNELNNDMEAVPISNSNLDSDEFNLSNSPPLLSVRSRMTELDDCDDVQYEATDPSTSFTLDEFLNL
ncbi:hypothetical protein K502DRAFT_326385 [Neoconidiobolus thromboides FSU 785]|nr:hypothetical protein K502DRAFT_326385 [Neoconidiobolus thromboides FSU 785]